jgi:uncharacterized phage-associated protein
MPVDARAIANLFLDMAAVRGHKLTPMSLLKILYFAHAWHLAKYKSPLVGQPFEAWKHGPVNRVVYEQIKKFGSFVIDEKLKKIDPGSGTFVEAICTLNGDKITFLENIFAYYSEFHPYKLSDITHEKGTPWDVVWNAAERSAVPGMLIPDELILKWFEKTGGRLYRSGEQGVNT